MTKIIKKFVKNNEGIPRRHFIKWKACNIACGSVLSANGRERACGISANGQDRQHALGQWPRLCCVVSIKGRDDMRTHLANGREHRKGEVENRKEGERSEKKKKCDKN